MCDSVSRFNDRANDYVKYRPGYPAEILNLLHHECGMTPQWRIADIGSGPGNLAKLFLKNGNPVYGVEPNAEMRSAGERVLAPFRWFRSVDGTAEATTLEDGCVEMITAGQAFHWFDVEKCRKEFKRILRPGGWITLVWNDRKKDGTTFMQLYERVMESMAPEYRKARFGESPTEAVRNFFMPNAPKTAQFPNIVERNWESLVGLALSSSYVPRPGRPGHNQLMEALRDIFERQQIEGKVRFLYDTRVYYGQLTVSS
jgi:ubiquinone/menaquinone biosynthesis C-methylase UbiE